jgi:hypothetical protein|tara:strand:+ start:65 stop:610 length:546 start_codon:yes stop_codon:yes gene_type:complete
MKFSPSCDGVYSVVGTTYTFKDARGKCPGDSEPEYDPSTGWKRWDYKERNEAKSTPLQSGKYEFMADVSIQADKFPHAVWYSVFQIHNGARGGQPPSILAVREGRWHVGNHDTWVPSKEDFALKVAIEIKENFITVDYYVDEEYLCSSRMYELAQPFIKFGLYRMNEFCSATQIYKNVRVN